MAGPREWKPPDADRVFPPDDVARGRAIDPEALAFERRMAFLVDELYDEDGSALEAAAARWEIAQRPDRAAFIRALGVAEQRPHNP